MRVFRYAKLILFVLFANGSVAVAEFSNKYPKDRLMIISNAQTDSQSFGMVMECPSHDHGTPAEAMAKLKKTLRNRPDDQASSIWVCRSSQMETLKMFAPVVDRIVVNPFVLTSKQGPNDSDIIWPKFDHSFVNRIRALRANGCGKSLFACIDLRGERRYFRKRMASFQEIQWMVYAVLGAKFQGIVWRGDHNDMPWANRLRQLEAKLGSYAEDIGHAQPVGWINASNSQPVSALCCQNLLFVILLNPDYLTTFAPDKSVLLPLDPSPRKGVIILAPPNNITILSGNTLLGMPLKLNCTENSIQVTYHFSGSGQILVFHLLTESISNPQQVNIPSTRPVKKVKP